MRENNRVLAATAVFAYALIALFHLISAKAGYSHYRDIHLGTAIEYAKGSIDILRPVIVGFNATGTPTPQELPIWQVLAGATFKCFGPWFGWANLLSLILFAAGLWPLYSLARHYLDERGAWWAIIFFLAQPIVILISGQASADGLSLALSIWFLLFAEKLVRTGELIWLLPSIVFGTLSAVTKLPLFMAKMGHVDHHWANKRHLVYGVDTLCRLVSCKRRISVCRFEHFSQSGHVELVFWRLALPA